MKKIIALLTALLLAVCVSGCSEWAEPAKVFYLNCVPEANEAWQKLASTYSDIYGVEVTVRTISSDDCAATIKNALGWENAPTAFMFHNAEDLKALKGNCLDLTGSPVLGQMITGSFNLTDGGAVKAMCYSYDTVGVMVNTRLLSEAGYELSAITDYETLKTVAQDIHVRQGELGFDAFTTFDIEGATALRLAELAQFYQSDETDSMSMMRQMVDLYLNNCIQAMPISESVTDLDQFAQEQAVFCQYSAAIYDALVAEPYGMSGSDLAIIPVFMAAESEQSAPLLCSPRNYWAVNSQASAADRQATLDFLNWVASSEEGISMLQEHFGAVPFKAASSRNKFYNDSNARLADGNYPIVLMGGIAADRHADISAAIKEYAIEPTDENWANVQNAIQAQ